MRTSIPSANSAELLMIFALLSSTWTLQLYQMIPGRKSDLASSVPPSFKLSHPKKLAEELLRKSFAVSKTGRRKIAIARSVEIDRSSVVRIVIEKREIDLTAVIEHDHLATVEVLNPMHMKPIVVRQSQSVRRTTVSLAWLRACCLTVAHWIHIEIETSENVIVTVIATATVSATEIATVNVNEIVNEIEIEIENETGTATENMHLDQGVMIRPAITIGRGGIAKRSVRGCTVAVLREAQ